MIADGLGLCPLSCNQISSVETLVLRKERPLNILCIISQGRLMSIFLDPEVVHPRHPHRIHNIFVNSHFLITVSACGFFCHWMDGREGKSSNFQLIFKQVSVDTHINLGNELDRQPSRQIRRHKVKTRAGTMEERRKKNECECRGPTAYALCVCPPSVSCGHQRPK